MFGQIRCAPIYQKDNRLLRPGAPGIVVRAEKALRQASHGITHQTAAVKTEPMTAPVLPKLFHLFAHLPAVQERDSNGSVAYARFGSVRNKL
jgi:hypothetical protein